MTNTTIKNQEAQSSWNEYTSEIGKNKYIKTQMSGKQKEMLLQLSKDTGVELKSNWEEYSSKSASKAIQILIDRPTVKQLNRIKALNEELGRKSGKINMNRNQASEWIEALQKSVKEKRKNSPASKELVREICFYYLCPDVDFSIIDIYNPKEIYDGKVMTRMYSSKELISILAKKTKGELEDFKYKFKSQYEEWKKTRATDNQVYRIVQLQGRLANIDRPQYEDENKNSIESCEMFVTEKKKEHTIPAKINIYTELQLKQLSKKQASALIQSLQYDLKDKESNYGYTDKEEIKKSKILEEIEEEKHIKNNDKGKRERKVFHKLYQHTGYLLDENDFTADEVKQLINDAINTDDVTPSQILEIVSESDIISKCLIMM